MLPVKLQAMMAFIRETADCLEELYKEADSASDPIKEYSAVQRFKRDCASLGEVSWELRDFMETNYEDFDFEGED